VQARARLTASRHTRTQAHDRRERLRLLLSKLDEAALQALLSRTATADEGEDGKTGEQEEEFFTEGSAALRDARMALLEFSMPRARDRLAHERADARRSVAVVLQQRREAEQHAKVCFHMACAHVCCFPPPPPPLRSPHPRLVRGACVCTRCSALRLLVHSWATTGPWRTVH
jgi:hypothetical protein